jgi:hypothetical protein
MNKRMKEPKEILAFLIENMGGYHPYVRNIKNGTILHGSNGKSLTISLQRKNGIVRRKQR